MGLALRFFHKVYFLVEQALFWKCWQSPECGPEDTVEVYQQWELALPTQSPEVIHAYCEHEATSQLHIDHVLCLKYNACTYFLGTQQVTLKYTMSWKVFKVLSLNFPYYISTYIQNDMSILCTISSTLSYLIIGRHILFGFPTCIFQVEARHWCRLYVISELSQRTFVLTLLVSSNPTHWSPE